MCLDTARGWPRTRHRDASRTGPTQAWLAGKRKAENNRLGRQASRPALSKWGPDLMRDQGRYERPRDQRGAPQRDPTTSSRGSGWSRSTTGESEFSEAGVLAIADDNMVEDGNADQRPRCRQLLGDLLVVVAGGRVSRRVVMHQNDRGRAVPDGLLEHLARVDLRRAQPANRHGRHSDYLMPRVQGQDAEVLPVQVTHLPAQQFIYVRGVVDNRTLRRRRRLGATAKLQRRHQGTRA